MSNTIENDHLWTDEEVEYKLARNAQDEVEANRKIYGPGGEREGIDDSSPEPEETVLELDREVYEHVIGLTVEQLRDELKDNKADSKGDEQELRAKLAQVLQAKRDADSNN